MKHSVIKIHLAIFLLLENVILFITLISSLVPVEEVKVFCFFFVFFMFEEEVKVCGNWLQRILAICYAYDNLRQLTTNAGACGTYMYEVSLCVFGWLWLFPFRGKSG